MSRVEGAGLVKEVLLQSINSGNNRIIRLSRFGPSATVVYAELSSSRHMTLPVAALASMVNPPGAALQPPCVLILRNNLVVAISYTSNGTLLLKRNVVVAME
jgi:hypothetical protein